MAIAYWKIVLHDRFKFLDIWCQFLMVSTYTLQACSMILCSFKIACIHHAHWYKNSSTFKVFSFFQVHAVMYYPHFILHVQTYSNILSV